jgi:hypothetical protein
VDHSSSNNQRRPRAMRTGQRQTHAQSNGQANEPQKQQEWRRRRRKRRRRCVIRYYLTLY